MGPLEKALLSTPPSGCDSCVAVAILFIACDALFLGIVGGLEINELKIPPAMAKEAKAVWGTNCPNTTVAPINGAPSNQKRAQQIVEKAQIFFFSLLTNSTVQVVRMAKVHDIAVLEHMAVNISNATRPLKGTAKKQEDIMN